MIVALLVFAAAVVLGALLHCAYHRPKDVYINGRKVELVALDAFRWLPVDWRHVSDTVDYNNVSLFMDGLLLRPLCAPLDVCTACGAHLLFSARLRMNGLCGPCTRAAAYEGWRAHTDRLRQLAREGKHR